MPIQPIDLQILFSQLANVGKEQAVLKEAGVISQSLRGAELVKEKEHEDNSVNQAKELSEGPDRIREEQRRRQEKQEEQEKKEKNKTEAEKKKAFFSDPDLGKHVDLSG